MKVSEILVKDSILLELKGREKREVLAEMAKTLANSTSGLDEKQLFEVLNTREKLQSTGIGEGVAVPHGKLQGLSHPVASFARSREGVDFGSTDGRPTHLFFLLATPRHSGGQHLKALARISRFLRDASFRERLREAANREEICRAIEEEDAKF